MNRPTRDSDSPELERERTIELLTGIHSSKKTYYPALRQKVDELEESNRLLERSLHSLVSISQALTLTTHGVDAFLERLTATVAGLTGAAQTVVLEARDGEGRGPVLVSLWPWSAGEDGAPEQTGARERLWDLLEAAEEPFWLERELGSALDPEPRPGAASTGAWLCIPMRRGVMPSGAVLAMFARRRRFEPSELEALRVLGSQTAVALENTRLYAEGERLRRRAEEAYGMAMQQKREVEQKHAQLEEALHRISAIEGERVLTEERGRIARDLHDTVAQVLYSMGLQLDWALSQAEPESELHERIVFLKVLAGGCVDDIRQTIFDLAPQEVGGTGLADALDKLVREYGQLCRAQVALEIPPGLPQLSTVASNELYRVAQEALFNVLKHARARRVWVRLVPDGEGVRLEVEDDGVGLPPDGVRRGVADAGRTAGGRPGDEGPRQGGYGLRTMRRRAEGLGGSLDMDTGEHGGTRVRAWVPLA